VSFALDASEVAAALESDLLRRWPALGREQPIGPYAEAVRARGRQGGYRWVDARLQAWCDELRARTGGADALEHYHRVVLAKVIQATRAELAEVELPDSIRPLVDAEHDRILRDLTLPKRNFYFHDNDAFAKDLAVASMRLIPCGSELVDTASGLPRSIALRSGLGQAMCMAKIGLRDSGFRPWFECHWDRRLLAFFTAAEYDRFYCRVADLLERFPRAKGLMTSSWWFDPIVATISPELAFLSATPMANGADRLRVGVHPVATKDALRFAKERSALHAAGRYQPCVYMLAWPRRPLVAWARRLRRA
jgi:hypothetical protein